MMKSATAIIQIACQKFLVSRADSWTSTSSTRNFAAIQRTKAPPTNERKGTRRSYHMRMLTATRIRMAAGAPNKMALTRCRLGVLLVAIAMTTALSPARTMSIRMIRA
jgi:hypothetical protein